MCEQGWKRKKETKRRLSDISWLKDRRCTASPLHLWAEELVQLPWASGSYLMTSETAPCQTTWLVLLAGQVLPSAGWKYQILPTVLRPALINVHKFTKCKGNVSKVTLNTGIFSVSKWNTGDCLRTQWGLWVKGPFYGLCMQNVFAEAWKKQTLAELSLRRHHCYFLMGDILSWHFNAFKVYWIFH